MDDKLDPIIEKQPLLRLLGHSNVVIAADWLGNSHVVSGSWDRTAIVYDSESGDVVNTLTGYVIKPFVMFKYLDSVY